MGAFRRIPLALVVLIPLASATLVLLVSPYLWVDTLFDDAYYYLGVARHLSLGHGSMFAPPLETNGYQPLWLLILTAFSLVVGADRTLLAAGMHLMILAVSLSFVLISTRQEGRHWPAALTVLCFPFVTLLGMETILILPLALLYFRVDGWKRGVLASLIFLGRLDALGLIIGREIYEVFVKRRIDFWANGVLVLVATAYATLNYTVFGTPVPISGLAKSVGNLAGENWRVGLLLIVRAAPAISALGLVWLARRALGFRYPMPIFAATFALASSAIYYSVFSGWTTWGWYHWPIALLFYFAILELLYCNAGPHRKVAIFFLAASVVTVPVAHVERFYLLPYQEMSWGEANVRMADIVNSSKMGNATFAMGDRAGSLGYFLDDRFQLIQTEGLVGNLAFLEALKDEQGDQFLEAAGTDYFVVDRGRYWLDGETYAIPEPLQGLSAKFGVMLLCFPAEAEMSDYRLRPHRKVFYFPQRVNCPPSAVKLFKERQQQYGAVRLTSLWTETPDGFFAELK